MRVAHGHGGISRLEHHRDRLANDKRAADHGYPGAVERHLVVVEKFYHSLGSAGRKAKLSPGKDAVERTSRDAVHVLGGIEQGADCGLIQGLRQWSKEKAAVDRRVLVDLADNVCQPLLRAIRRQDEFAKPQANLLGTLGGTPLVGEVILALPHPHDGERGSHALLSKCLHLGD